MSLAAGNDLRAEALLLEEHIRNFKALLAVGRDLRTEAREDAQEA